MRFYVTGCGASVPVNETGVGGFTVEGGTREACTQSPAGFPLLLGAQTLAQAQQVCRQCPAAGHIAPHLAVKVGDDRVPVTDPVTTPREETVTLDPSPLVNAIVPHQPQAPPAQPAPDNDCPDWQRQLFAAMAPSTTPAAPPPPSAPPAPAPVVGTAAAVRAARQGPPVEPELPAPEPELPQTTMLEGACGTVVTFTRRDNGKFYTNAPVCANTHVAPGTAPASLQKLCAGCGLNPAVAEAVAALPTDEPLPPPPIEPEPAPIPAHVQPPAAAVYPGVAPDAAAAFEAAMTHPNEKPPVLSLLPPELNTGASIMGSSTMRSFQTCMRAGFYRHIKGLRRPRETEYFDGRYWKFDPLALGTLVHGVLARFYLGDEDPYAFLAHVQPHYPHIMEETRRLCTYHFNAYAQRDRQILDVRFVEQESRLYFKKKRVKSAKKSLSICISCRSDLGFARKGPDQPRLPPGVRAESITIMDHKTTAYMTAATKEAYQHDPQIFANAAAYGYGNSVEPDGSLGAPSAERFGPMTHFAINLIGKAFNHKPADHLLRTSQMIPEPLIETYRDDIQAWLYGELAERLFHPAAADEATWPKSYLCRDPSTGRPCPYITVCGRGGLAQYNPAGEFNADGPVIDPAALLRPEVKKPARRKRAKAAADVEQK